MLQRIHSEGEETGCYATILRAWEHSFQDEYEMTDRTEPVKKMFDRAKKCIDDETEETYFSINSFYKNKRLESNVRHLNAFALDLDFYRNRKYAALDPPTFYGEIKSQLPFLPTYVVDSGRGLYLIYCFHHCSKVRVKLYKALYKAFITQLKEFGADSKVALVTQVIRIPGTYNAKAMKPVEIIEENDTQYVIEDFVALLPYTYEEVKLYKEKLQKNFTSKKDKAADRRFRKNKSAEFYKNVYDDLKRLIRIRNACGQNEGYRETMIYIVRELVEYYGGSEKDSINRALKLNHMLNSPLDQKAVIKQCKPSQIFINSHSIDRIIEKLDITDTEQEHLYTLINKRRRRQKELRYKKNKRVNSLIGMTEKQWSVLQRRIQVAELKRQGYQNVAIASELQVGRQLVQSDLRFIKEHPYLFAERLQNILHDALDQPLLISTLNLFKEGKTIHFHRQLNLDTS